MGIGIAIAALKQRYQTEMKFDLRAAGSEFIRLFELLQRSSMSPT